MNTNLSNTTQKKSSLYIKIFKLLMSIKSMPCAYRDFFLFFFTFIVSDRAWHFWTVPASPSSQRNLRKFSSKTCFQLHSLFLIDSFMSNIIPKSLMSCQNVSTSKLTSEMVMLMFDSLRVKWIKIFLVLDILLIFDMNNTHNINSIKCDMQEMRRWRFNENLNIF